MIAIRTWLARRRRTVGLLVAVATVVAAVVLAHGGGESKLMSEHPGGLAMELCVATLELGVAALGAIALLSRRRLPRGEPSLRDGSPRLHRPPLGPPERSPPLLAPNRLQVFLS